MLSQMVATVQGSTTKYHHADHLSMRVTSDSSGTIIASSGHYPFGENWYETGGTNKLKFTSYERDAESANDYAVFRSHINRLGRFSSPDPISGSVANPQSLNRYAYTLNAPVNLIDPQGLDSIGAKDNVVNFIGKMGRGWSMPSNWSPFDLMRIPIVLHDYKAVEGYANLTLQGPDGPYQWQGEVTGLYPTTFTVGNGLDLFDPFPQPQGGTQPGGREQTEKNPCAPPRTGIGGGLVVGAGATAGAGAAGVTASGSAGAGAFYNSQNGASVGAFETQGAAARWGSHVAGSPAQNQITPLPLGASVGGGGGVFITNAGSAQQLRGPFSTWSASASAGSAGATIDVSYANGVWVVSVMYTPGFGVSFSALTTRTSATGTGCP